MTYAAQAAPDLRGSVSEVEIAERILNHTRERMDAAYGVHDYIDEKR